MEKTLSRSAKKFIRLEKARIRTAVFEFQKQEQLIEDLYKKMKQAHLGVSQESVTIKPEAPKTAKKPPVKKSKKVAT